MTVPDDSQTTPAPSWLPLIWLALGVVAAFRVLHATAPFGPGVSGDSLQYMSAALHIAAGETVKGWNGGMYVSWPPLYPALLAVAESFDGNMLEFARWLNAIALGGTVFIVGMFGLRHVRSPSVRSFGTAIVCLSVALFENGVMLWSEPLFILIFIAQLSALMAFLNSRSKFALVLAAILASAASMQRYPGVTLIGVSGLAILFPMAETKFRWRVVEAGMFGVIAASPLALWLKRNRDLEGIATSWAGGVTRPVSENLVSAFNVAFTWLIPSSPIYRLAAFIIIGIAAPLVMYALIRSGIGKRVRAPIALHLFLVIVYVAFLCYSGARYSIEPINQRYLSPVYISLVVIVISLLDIAVAYWRDRTLFHVSGKAIATTVMILCTAWLYYPYASVGISTDRYRRDGVFGFTRSTYVQSPFIQYAREHVPRDAEVFSNHPELLFVNAGITSVKPFEDRAKLHELIMDVSYGDRPIYLVWFQNASGGPPLPILPEVPLTSETLPDTPGGVIQGWNAAAP